ncbi:MAG: outer membrane beta-barrel protein [Candidatus Cyclobacteriaceae bacterium M2_1C_046]
MKKYLILVLALTFSLQIHAQLQQGAMFVGGSFHLSGSNSESINPNVNSESESSLFALHPFFGYSIKDNLMLGIGISYRHDKYDYTQVHTGTFPWNTSYESVSNSFFISPFLTKFIEIKDKLFLTASLQSRIGFGKSNYDYLEWDDYETSDFYYSINISPGLSYFISNRWALRSGLGGIYYSFQKNTRIEDGTAEELKDSTSRYGLNLNFNTFSIGVQYFLKNGKGEE